MQGKVLWFSDRKGFGFIRPKDTDGQEDVFAHQSEIRMQGFRFLRQDDLVEFDTEETPKGTKAVNIRVLQEAPPQRGAGFPVRTAATRYEQSEKAVKYDRR